MDNGWRQGTSETTDSLPKDKTFYASAGETVRFVICWDSYTDWNNDPSVDSLEADLDLWIADPNGNHVGVSCSWDNNYEVVDFTAPVSGTYTACINDCRFDGAYEWLGVAWSRSPAMPTTYTFNGDISQGQDSTRHNFNVLSDSAEVYARLDMPSGTDFDLSVWNDQNRRTGGWLSTESYNRYDIPNSGYSGYSADPEWVDVSPPATSGAWDTGCYAFYGSGTYTMTVEVTP